MNSKKIFARLTRLLSKEDIRMLDGILHARMARDVSSYREQINRAYWEKAGGGWDHTPHPIRPSAGDIAAYRSFFARSKKKEPILILGSTPELRDMVAELPDAKIYLADFSYTMPLAMLAYTQYVDPLQERWVKDDWLELPFPEGFFDVILGDLVLQQYSPDSERDFLKKIRFLLHADGSFISRFQFLGEDMRDRSVTSVVDTVLEQKLTEGQMITLLKLYVPLLYANPATRTIDRTHASRMFREFLMQYPNHPPFLDTIPERICSPTLAYRDWSPPNKTGLDHILSAYFTIADANISKDYRDAQCYPLYLLRPR